MARVKKKVTESNYLKSIMVKAGHALRRRDTEGLRDLLEIVKRSPLESERAAQVTMIGAMLDASGELVNYENNERVIDREEEEKSRTLDPFY